jgi:hypothetical protein
MPERDLKRGHCSIGVSCLDRFDGSMMFQNDNLNINPEVIRLKSSSERLKSCCRMPSNAFRCYAMEPYGSRQKLEILLGDKIIFTSYHFTNGEAYGQCVYYGPVTHKVHINDFVKKVCELIPSTPQEQNVVVSGVEEDVNAVAAFEKQGQHYIELRRKNGTLCFRQDVEWMKIQRDEVARRNSIRQA